MERPPYRWRSCSRTTAGRASVSSSCCRLGRAGGVDGRLGSCSVAAEQTRTEQTFACETACGDTLGARPMREMTVYGVSFDLVGKQPIVLLKTQDGNTFLPIWIGHPEAAAILMNLQGTEPPRPMTHDLATVHRRLARRRDPPGHGHGAAREHVLRADHHRPQRHRDRARRAHLGRDRARPPHGREDLRRRGGDRGVGRRVRRRRGGGVSALRAAAVRHSRTSIRTSSAASSTPSRRTSSPAEPSDE